MDVIYILLPISLFLGLVGCLAYLWNVKSGQYEDLSTPAVRILTDESGLKSKKESESITSNEVDLPNT